jgi:hypothetical protein
VELEDVGDAQREAEDYAEDSDPVEISQVCIWSFESFGSVPLAVYTCAKAS